MFLPRKLQWTGLAAAVLVTGCDPAPFTIVLLPDTQYYSQGDCDTYKKQTQWIVDHKDSRNIQVVLHLGDITDDANESQFNCASAAHRTLDEAGVHYLVVPGNHDYEDDIVGYRNSSKYNEHFPFSRYPAGLTRGHFESTNDNNYALLDVGDLRFLIVGLEFAPRKNVLCWADELIQEHPDRRVIVVTHCYMKPGGAHDLDCAVGRNVVGGNGDVIWDELVRRHNNLFLVVCGHTFDSELKDPTGDAGNKVYEMLVDYQKEQRDGGSHGQGWMRTLRFVPGENRIDVETFTVLDDVTSFNHSEYDSDPAHVDHTYSMDYDMQALPAYAYSGTSPVFNDLTVNSDANRQQMDAAIDAAANGDFVVAWSDDSAGAANVYQIYARGFYASGCEKVPDMTVNSASAGQQRDPDIGVASDGSFVVVWEDDGNGNNIYEVEAAGFSPTGARRFGDMTVNDTSSGQQRDPSVGTASDGSFVVVWEDDRNTNNVYEIRAAGFTSTGARRFGDVTVNDVSRGQQRDPRVDVADNGVFVVTWEDDRNDNNVYEIRAAGFSATGGRLFADVKVNASSTRQQLSPDIGIAADGSFIVVWEDDSRNPSGIYQIFAAGFNASGAKIISDFTVNQVAHGQQYQPRVSVAANRSFVVVWEDDSSDPAGVYQILAASFDPNGTRVAGDMTVNTDASGQQRRPAVTHGSSGVSLVAWEDDMNGNDAFQVMVRGLMVR